MAKARTKTPAAKKKEPARKTGAAFLLALRGHVDSIRELVGSVELKTLKEVADAFDVSQETVKTGWRPMGMPGQAGSYDLAEVIAWKIGRQLRAEGRASVQGEEEVSVALDRKRLADARKAEADAEGRERENAVAVGNILYRDDVERELAEMIIAARENFLRIPREMLPRFPKHVAEDLRGELATKIEASLTVMAEWRPKALGVGEEEEQTDF